MSEMSERCWSLDSKSPYRVFKLVNGEDIMCKLLKEDEHCVLVECPMIVQKQEVAVQDDKLIESTSLKRWISNTNDSEIILNKDRIIGSATLSAEISVYYKMLVTEIKDEYQINLSKVVNEDEVRKKITGTRNDYLMMLNEFTDEDDEEIILH